MSQNGGLHIHEQWFCFSERRVARTRTIVMCLRTAGCTYMNNGFVYRDKPMASVSTCHLGVFLWIAFSAEVKWIQFLLNGNNICLPKYFSAPIRSGNSDYPTLRCPVRPYPQPLPPSLIANLCRIVFLPTTTCSYIIIYNIYIYIYIYI